MNKWRDIGINNLASTFGMMIVSKNSFFSVHHAHSGTFWQVSHEFVITHLRFRPTYKTTEGIAKIAKYLNQLK